jgi:hypothetical protein
MPKKTSKTYMLDENIVKLITELEYHIPLEVNKSEVIEICIKHKASRYCHIPKVQDLLDKLREGG